MTPGPMRHLSCDDSRFTDGHYLPGPQSSEPRYAALNVKLQAGPRATGAQNTRDSFYLKSRKAAQRRGYLGLERDERVSKGSDHNPRDIPTPSLPSP